MPSVARLIEALSSPDSTARAEAAEQLAALGPDAESALSALIRALDDDSFRVQLWAVRALGGLGAAARAAVPKLRRTLADEGLRLAALLTLGKIGPAAKEALPEIRELAAASKIDEISEAAAMAIYRVEGRSRQALVFLQTLVAAGRDPKARARAAADLGEMGDPAAVLALIRALEDPAAAVRREAARALGRLGPAAKGALAALEKLLADPRDDGARITAAEALWHIDQRTLGLSFLCQLIQRPQHRDHALCVRAVRSIGVMGERARPALSALVEALDDPSEELRSAIAEALMKIQPRFS